MTKIFIFNNASRAAGYGIGTYVKQLSDGLSSIPDMKVSLVEMYADTKEFAISDDENGIRHYLIPPQHSNVENEIYCRIIFYFLARSIETDENDKVVFQFNYFQHYPLAMLLKAWYINSSIVLTVHYMSWCFELNGNVQRMKEIIAKNYESSDDVGKRVMSSFVNEKLFLHLADMVFVLSKNTKDILVNDYRVASGKIHLVYNGIGTKTCDNKVKSRIILFVGRLEDGKGLKYLIDAFAQIAEIHPDSVLMIVGDGDFQPYMAQSRNLLGRIVFFGKMQKDEIENVYQLAYMGVVPSFHEQCSYTVIEMMRHGIPIVGTDSIGLAEMLDVTPELQVHIDKKIFNEDDFVSQMACRMNLLLSNNMTYHLASDAVCKQYEERYTITAMVKGVQKALLTTLAINNDQVSSDYLPHIDEQMINLINRQPDIDMDFYGITGIGVYLWWRVLQLERENIGNVNQLAFIKEHLIYYLDWVEEIVRNEPFPLELYATLVSMREYMFYPTKVEEILKYGKDICDGAHFPSKKEILHNALKICTCKI